MCGIVGLHLRNPALYPRLGELLTGMLCEMSDRGRDSAGVAVYGDPRWSPPGRASRLAARRRRSPEPSRGSAVRARRRRSPRRWSATTAWCTAAVDSEALLAAVERGATRPRWSPASATDLTVLKGVGHPQRRSTAAWGLARRQRLAGRRAHPDGHRVGGHRRRARTRSPSAPTSAWCTTARSPTTPPSAANCAPPACVFDSENDTEVGARFVAEPAGRGPRPGDGAEGAVRHVRRLLHAAGLQPRLVRRRPRRDRLQARRHRRDRRLGGDGLRVPRPGRPARRRERAHLRARAGGGVRMDTLNDREHGDDLRPRGHRPARRQRRPARTGPTRASSSIDEPRRRAQRRGRHRRAGDGHRRRSRRLLRRRHEPAGRGHRQRQRRHRGRREHDERHGPRHGQRLAVRRRHRPRRPARRSTAMPLRAAASR